MLDLKSIMAHLDTVDGIDGSWHSYPLPFVESTLKVKAYFAIARFDGKSGLIFSPITRVVDLDARTGDVVSINEIHGGDALGRQVFDVSPDDLSRLQDRLGHAYARLLPSFQRGDSNPAPGLEPDAKEYIAIYPMLEGKAFMPTSWKYGQAWLSWLGMPNPNE